AVARPSVLNWPDRRCIAAAYAASWGSYPLCYMYAKLYGLSQDGTSSIIFPSGSPIPSPHTINQGDQTANFELFRTTLLATAGTYATGAVAINAQGCITWDIETGE